MARRKIVLFQTADELIRGYGLNGEKLDGTRETAKEIKRTYKEKRHVYLKAKKLFSKDEHGKTYENGKISLFLYYFKGDSKQRQYLKIILNPETDKDIKARNEESYRQALTTANEKDVELQKDINGFALDVVSKKQVLPYIADLAERKLKETGNKQSYFYILNSLSQHMALCFGDNIRFNQIDKKFVLKFIDYLKTANNLNYQRAKAKKKKILTIGKNAQYNLFKKFAFVIGEAVKDGYITNNPIKLLEPKQKPSPDNTERQYLTIGELKNLMATECRNETLKRAFLFCCLVGIRYSDIKALTWGNIVKSDIGYQLDFKVKKTGSIETPPVSDEAMKWLPKRNKAKDDELIYKLPKNDSANAQLSRWVKSASISKKITWHCSRHTAATLNLSLGVPIEVVSKLLGHSRISTTQIYAKIVNTLARNEVDKQNGIFDNK
jgi:integrase